MAQADDGQRLPPELRPGHPLLGLGYSEPTRTGSHTRITSHGEQHEETRVAEEVPVAFVYNARPHVVMMATPANLDDFATGFSLTEGIIPSADRLERVEVIRFAQGVEVQLRIPDSDAARLAERGRALIGRVGCGLCGVESIEDVLREPAPLAEGPAVPLDAIWRAGRELPAMQEWNRETGALHAAAWASLDGEPLIVREDVGRHNALDKVIGAMARADVDPATGFLLITSRASYELVQKTVVAGVGLLAAVSRPTGLAIRLAEAHGLTLVGLLRDETANIHSHPDRILRG